MRLGKLVFAASLVLLMGSLFLSLREIWMSVIALDLQLGDLEETRARRGKGATPPVETP